ncbi:MAG: hypothetical protein ACOYXT_01070 [Bacteroidota bacterium]
MEDNTTAKEQWIDRVMQSVQKIAAPPNNPYLYQKVLLRLKQQKESYVAPMLIWLTAVSLILIVLLNIAVIRKNSGALKGDGMATVISAYDLDSRDFYSTVIDNTD